LRLAYKIARGTRYVDGHELLENITPERWAYLKASYYLDPYGDDWERNSMIAAQIINSIRCALPGAQLKPEDLLPNDIFVPNREYVDPKIAQLEAALPSLDVMEGLE
jgi:hypothetical protein